MAAEEDSWRQRLMEEGDSYFERNDNNDSAHDLVFEALSYVHATRPIS